MPPDAFLSIAERAGLIGEISTWVARESCRQAQAWQKDGIDLCVSFNLPPVLWQPPVLRNVIELLDEYQLQGSALAIEITEAGFGPEILGTAVVLEELRDRGVSISFDDFGTGHSSLSRLTTIPATTLKIDRDFVREIPSSKQAKTLVTSIVQLAHNLGFVPLAEGVETEAQRQFLLDRRCELAQGFLQPSRPGRRDRDALHSAGTAGGVDGLARPLKRSEHPSLTRKTVHPLVSHRAF